MKSNLLLLTTMLSVVGFTFPRNALADPTTQARILYQKGNAAFRDGDDVMAREYYRKSLETQFSFDTVCNLGRSEARSKLHQEAYENLRLCVELYPADEELADAKAKFADLRDEVRAELTYEQAKPIEDKVEARLAELEAEPAAEETADEAPLVDAGLGEEPEEEQQSSARVPVSVILGGTGLAAVGVGTALVIVSGNKSSSADAIRAELVDDGRGCVGTDVDPRCSELADKSKAADSTRIGGAVGLAAGGALLVGGVLVFVLWKKGKTSSVDRAVEPMSVLPDVALSREGGWTLGIRGRF